MANKREIQNKEGLQTFGESGNSSQIESVGWKYLENIPNKGVKLN